MFIICLFLFCICSMQEMEECGQEEVAYVDECGPADSQIDYHAHSEEFEEVDGSIDDVEVVVHLVDDCQEGDDK